MRNKTGIFLYIFLGLILVVSVAVYLIPTIQRGWKNNDTITLIFSSMVPSLGLVVFYYLSNFLNENNFKIIATKFELYKMLKDIFENNEFDALELFYLRKEQIRNLDEINNILKRQKNKLPQVTLENIGGYENKYLSLFSKQYIKTNIISKEQIKKRINRIQSRYNPNFYKIYSKFTQGELIRQPKFPFLETILPTLLGAISLFITIYQMLNNEEPLITPLMDYMWVLLAFLCLMIGFSIYQISSGRESILKHVKNEIKNLEEFKNSKQ